MQQQNEQRAPSAEPRENTAPRPVVVRSSGVIDISGRLRRLSHQRRYTVTRMR